MKFVISYPMFRKMDHYIEGLYGNVNAWRQFRYGMGIVWNYLRYEATISDYFELRFYEKHHSEKKKYITSKRALRFAQFVDGEENLSKLFSKAEMYRELRPFCKRDQLYTQDCSYNDFCAFTESHPQCLYKPDRDDCGHGIEKWNVTAENREALYQKAIAEPAILDELVIQHPQMASLHPDSVNTVRLYTLLLGGECVFISGFLRIGRHGAAIDNLGSGGVIAGFDLKTGEVISDALDDVGHHFERHPDTDVCIRGFRIPNWDKLLEFTKECAKHYTLKYVGWDIAVCSDSFQIIEANPDPMIHGIQFEYYGPMGEKYETLWRALERERDNVIR